MDKQLDECMNARDLFLYDESDDCLANLAQSDASNSAPPGCAVPVKGCFHLLSVLEKFIKRRKKFKNVFIYAHGVEGGKIELPEGSIDLQIVHLFDG